MAHTPGPWIVDKSGFNVIRSTAPITIAMTQPSTHMKDDARLIAVAPDLLAACRSLVEALEMIGRDHAVWWPHDGDLVVRARAAIAKATGGES